MAEFYQIDQILAWLWFIAAASVPAVALDSAPSLPNAYLPLRANNCFHFYCASIPKLQPKAKK